MNDVIVELKKERDALRARLEKIEAAIEEYERWAQSVAELVEGGTALKINDVGANPDAAPTPVSAFEAEVRALFARVSAPLKRAEVHDALTQAGVVVGGKDPLNTVASRLSRMDGITNLKGYGYWAEDRPFPAAGYEGGAVPAASLFAGDGTGQRESAPPAAEGEGSPREAE